MFTLDHFGEVFQTLRRNRLRTFLTACGVFWGVFMLVVMLGFGQGLKNGATQGFGSWALNTVGIWPEVTSKPYAGRAAGRDLKLYLDDADSVQSKVPGVLKVLPRTMGGGRWVGNRVSRKDKSESFNVSGESADYLVVEDLQIERGRFLNQVDQAQARKVAVIGARVVEVLFDKDEDPIGASIRVGNTPVTVVGVHRTTMTGRRAEWANGRVFMPRTTVALMFGRGQRINHMTILLEPTANSVAVASAVKAHLRQRHSVHPEDERAFGDWNRAEQYAKVNTLFNGIATLTWFVGVLTLLAGAMGVSNIMMIAVSERTREIGIRKALGATPLSIMSQVVSEATVLTGLAGYLGLVAGVVIVEGTAQLMARLPPGQGPGFFGPPQVDLAVALLAAVVLTVAGALAGLAPARSAVSIRPVEALAHE
jgi:putative ABC transport system permease protein